MQLPRPRAAGCDATPVTLAPSRSSSCATRARPSPMCVCVCVLSECVRVSEWVSVCGRAHTHMQTHHTHSPTPPTPHTFTNAARRASSAALIARIQTAKVAGSILKCWLKKHKRGPCAGSLLATLIHVCACVCVCIDIYYLTIHVHMCTLIYIHTYRHTYIYSVSEGLLGTRRSARAI